METNKKKKQSNQTIRILTVVDNRITYRKRFLTRKSNKILEALRWAIGYWNTVTDSAMYRL
jgi:hypothetical protein